MSDLLDLLITPLNYQYMIKAIWVSALIGCVCGFLSSYITLKGWSLMGDALSHAVVPGVAIAYIVGLPFSLGAFVSGLLAAGAMSFVKMKSRIREDAVIGIIFTTFFALGLLIISIYPSRVDLKMIVFGNILGISNSDSLQVVIVSCVTLVVLFFSWKNLMLISFDPSHARALGMRVGMWNLLLTTLLSAMAVSALQAVGACLVVAMLVTPGATAYLLTDRFSKMLIISSSIGILASIIGAYVSYFFNGATGGCIVTLQVFFFLMCFFFAPKHGIIASKKRSKIISLQV
jgi:manganese/iron transport system permease protein